MTPERFVRVTYLHLYHRPWRECFRKKGCSLGPKAMEIKPFIRGRYAKLYWCVGMIQEFLGEVAYCNTKYLTFKILHL